MNTIAFFDLVATLATLSAFVLLLVFFRRFPLRDMRWLLLILLLMDVFDHLSNFLEWSGLTISLDYFEDLAQISIPLLFMMIFYGFRQIRSQRSVEISERKFRSIAEQTSDLIFITDASGIITYVSPSAFSMFGYKIGRAHV